MMRLSKYSTVLIILAFAMGCSAQQTHDHSEKSYPLEKADAEWRAELTDMEYKVLRNHGTERAFTGDLLNNLQKGTYSCAACGQGVFSSDTKFKSGTGWPSFYAPLAEDSVGTTIDQSYGMTRTEVHCSNCGGHLGHVFRDGPKPTGLRYCINSVSLDFEKR